MTQRRRTIEHDHTLDQVVRDNPLLLSRFTLLARTERYPHAWPTLEASGPHAIHIRVTSGNA